MAVMPDYSDEDSVVDPTLVDFVPFSLNGPGRGRGARGRGRGQPRGNGELRGQPRGQSRGRGGRGRGQPRQGRLPCRYRGQYSANVFLQISKYNTF